MFRRVFLALVLSASLSAQSVVKQLFNSATAAAAIEIPNVGQAGHLVYVQLTSAAAHTCTSPTFGANLEESFDRTTWVAFGSPHSSLTPNAATALYQGSGSYNYLRFNVSTFDTTNCVLSAWYTGTPQAIVLGVQGAAGSSGQVAFRTSAGLETFTNPVVIGGLGSGGGGGGRPYPVTACDSTASALITAGTSGLVRSNGGTPMNVCAVAITLTANGTVHLFYGSDATCAVQNADLSPTFTLNAGIPLAFGAGIGAVFTQDQGYSTGSAKPLCAAATGGNAAIWISFASY